MLEAADSLKLLPSCLSSPSNAYAAVLLVLVITERDNEADSDKPEEDKEGMLSEVLVAVRCVPEPESVFEFELKS